MTPLFMLLPIQQPGEPKPSAADPNTFGQSSALLDLSPQEWLIGTMYSFYWGPTQKTWDSHSKVRDQRTRVSDC